ncbi:hypothetical protein ODU72_04965 [Lactobacillus amylovorus]|uniref:Uncharacterized protein n=1 Tax=Lactobacillus amylovorus TaxID=1604 RepID=A0A9X3W5Q1_LACAM|nr:hypothetical protein [Lactobacillus amylovorus]MDB6258030.1 hypothetical protein [Lactobacillus amylovorus]
MNDAEKWLNQIIADIPSIKEEMYEDAKTFPTYGKAKKYLKDFKNDFNGNYTATPEEQMQSVFNTMIEDVIQKLNQDADKVKINHD